MSLHFAVTLAAGIQHDDGPGAGRLEEKQALRDAGTCRHVGNALGDRGEGRERDRGEERRQDPIERGAHAGIA